MTRDVHLISEAYLAAKKVVVEQTPTPAQPVQPPVVAPGGAAPMAAKPVQPQVQQPVQQPQQPPAPTVKGTKEQEKAVNDLLKAFGLPAEAAPYLIQTLVQGVPALKQQYGL